MNINVLPNGNLEISVSEECDQALLAEIFERHGQDEDSFMDELLEQTGWTPNGRLYRVNPADVGALTSSTILTDELAHSDDGDVKDVGKVWWFPDYAVLSWVDMLRQNGRAVFPKA